MVREHDRATGGRARWRRALAAGLTGVLCAGCGSGGGTGTALVSDSLPTAATALSALGSVRDSAEARTSISVLDLAAIWTAAGLPAQPSLHQFASRRGDAASVQTGAADSPIGSGARDDAVRYPSPFGYRILGLRVELDVGSPPAGLSEVWGAITAAKVSAAVAPVKPTRSTVGQSTLLDFGPRVNLKAPGGLLDALIDLRFLAVPRRGGRAVSGGKGAGASAVTDLANAEPVADPVSADPTVAPLLKAFGTGVQSITLGSGYISQGWATDLSPAALQRERMKIGLARLPSAPVMVGLAYTGGPPSHQSVIAAALYPSQAAATAAVATVGRYCATGDSPKLDVPYRHLWHVTSDMARGRLVTLRLTTSDGAPTEALIRDDFPLFWAP